MSTNVTKLFQSAALLTPAELEELYQKLSALRLLTGAAEPTPPGKAMRLSTGDWAERALYSAVTDRLHTKLKRQPAPWGAFKSSPHYAKFRAVVEKVLKQHEQWCPRQEKLQKTSMLLLYGQLTVDYIVDGRASGQFQHSPWRDALALLAEIATVVDHYFPGYAASGLLIKVAEMRAHNRKIVGGSV